jgi:hypothetical protein
MERGSTIRRAHVIILWGGVWYLYASIGHPTFGLGLNDIGQIVFAHATRVMPFHA